MEPNFWRPVTDNEFGWGAEKKLKCWKDAGVLQSQGGSLICTSLQVIETKVGEADESSTTMQSVGMFGKTVKACFDLCHNGTKLDIYYQVPIKAMANHSGDLIITSTLHPSQQENTALSLFPGQTVVLRNLASGRHLDVEVSVYPIIVHLNTLFTIVCWMIFNCPLHLRLGLYILFVFVSFIDYISL